MRRRLYMLAATASVTLAAVAIVMTLASFSGTARWRLSAGPPRAWFVQSDHGLLHVWFQELSFTPELPAGFSIDVSEATTMTLIAPPDPADDSGGTHPMYYHMEVMTADRELAGFGIGDGRSGNAGFPIGDTFYVANGHWASVQAPWLVIAPLACAPMAWLLAVGRRRVERLSAGKCLHCGYDLRASPQRCPECGEPVNDPDEATELRTFA